MRGIVTIVVSLIDSLGGTVPKLSNKRKQHSIMEKILTFSFRSV